MKPTPPKKSKTQLYINITLIVAVISLMAWGIFAPRVGDPPGFHAQRLEDFYYKKGKSPTGRNCTVVEIDGCEYIEFQTSLGYHGLTHKGNCKNPIHYKPHETTTKTLIQTERSN